MKKLNAETIKALRNAQSNGLSLRKAAKSLGLSVGTVHNYWQAPIEQCSSQTFEHCSNDTEPKPQAIEQSFEHCSNEQCSNEIVQIKKTIEQLQNAIEQLQARITTLEISQPTHRTRPTSPTQEITRALAQLHAHFKEYAKLAKALGLSPNTVRNWFNGYTPSIERQTMIFKLLEEVQNEHRTIENSQS